MRLHAVHGFGREFRLIAGSLVYPTHLVGVERDLIRRIRQFETEADTGTLVIVHGRIGSDRVIIVVGDGVEAADDIIVRTAVVAAFVVFVERGGAGRPAGELEFRHEGAVRVEHVVDGHVGRDLTLCT